MDLISGLSWLHFVISSTAGQRLESFSGGQQVGWAFRNEWLCLWANLGDLCSIVIGEWCCSSQFGVCGSWSWESTSLLCQCLSQVEFFYPTIPFCPHCPISFVPLPPLFLCPSSPLSLQSFASFPLSSIPLFPQSFVLPIVYCSYNTFPLFLYCPIVPFHCPIVNYCTLFLLVYIQ